MRKYYGRASRVLYPPVETGRFAAVPNPAADYFLIVSRLLPYKRVDLAVQAANKLGVRLKVVGGGADLPRLKALAGSTVEILGRQPDAEVVRLLQNCKAFVFPGEEDFGIAPVEAMASGRPVIAFRAGGALETVVEDETGVFFDAPTADSLADAMRRIDTMPVDGERLRRHALRFDTVHFQNRLRRLVDECVAEHQSRYAAIAPAFGKDDSPLPPRYLGDAAPLWSGDDCYEAKDAPYTVAERAVRMPVRGR